MALRFVVQPMQDSREWEWLLVSDDQHVWAHQTGRVAGDWGYANAKEARAGAQAARIKLQWTPIDEYGERAELTPEEERAEDQRRIAEDMLFQARHARFEGQPEDTR
jgi:hypothetical protein